MDNWPAAAPAKPKSRSKLMGCLVGCFIAVGVLLLFFIIIAYLLFRAHPSVDEETFFTPDTTGFVRFHMDALKREPTRQLLKKSLENLAAPEERQNLEEVDIEGFWSALGILLHQKHFLFYYKGEDQKQQTLFVLDIKRFSWVVSSLFKEAGNSGIEKINPPEGVKAKCFFFKKAENPVYLGVTSRAILVSNSRPRLMGALSQLYSKKPPGDLSPNAREILPADEPSDMINGFLFREIVWNEKIHANLLENYPEKKDNMDLLHQALSQGQMKGVRFRVRHVTSNVFKVQFDLNYSSESEAASPADAYRRFFSSGILPRNVEADIQKKGNMLRVNINIPGVEDWLLEMIKDPEKMEEEKAEEE